VFNAAAAVTPFEFKLTLDWDDQLRNHREHLCATLLKHIHHTLDGQEAIGILFLADALEENRQVVVVIQLHDIDLPENLVGWAVLNRNGKITSVIETSEFRGHNRARSKCTSHRSLGHRLILGLQQRAVLTSNALASLESGYN
jgi:hypothetical protein